MAAISFPNPRSLLTVALALPPILLVVLSVLPHRKPPPKLPPLPDGIKRVFIDSGDFKGRLEILVAKPDPDKHERKAPLVFVHGGYGSAFCWTHWLSFFASRGRSVYAISLSGHGLSTRPSHYQLRPKSYFAEDVLKLLEFVAESESLDTPPPILIGHSGGGGLCQHVLDVHGDNLRAKESVSGLILVSPFPPDGGWSVYINWFKFDPFLSLRMLFNLGDPYTVLSTPQRVSRAFFGTAYNPSASESSEILPNGFMDQITKEESVGWPSSMILPFVNVKVVSQNLTYDNMIKRIYFLAGKNDALMDPKVMKGIAQRYDCALDFVEGAGHHMMHDMQWEEGAELVERKLMEWGV